MARKKKFPPLVTGQRVWIETRSMFMSRDPIISEHEIVRVNKTSAYAVDIDRVNDERAFEARISQRNGAVENGIFVGYTHTLWLSLESYEAAKHRQAELRRMRELARNQVGAMSLDELYAFLPDEQPKSLN